ncbi:hypothetical protein NKG94_22755 [Micromonospora sp. M12]
MADRPVVSSLTWRDAPPVVDLAGTGLQHLSLRGADVREVRLPRGLHGLELAAVDPSLAVYAADDGRWLHLTLADAEADTTVPAGLHGVQEVALDGGGTMSAAAVREVEELESLRIFWRKPRAGWSTPRRWPVCLVWPFLSLSMATVWTREHCRTWPR